jgi:hypothetical protein
MPITKKRIVILRAGTITAKAIRKGAERVDTVDKVYNLSVQATLVPGKQDAPTTAMLLAAVPHANYALTYSSNITVDDLVEIFKINKH